MGATERKVLHYTVKADYNFMKDSKEYIIKRIESGSLFKHFERDYSIFFLSSFGNSHAVANQAVYGNSGLTLALMTFCNNISSYYRLERDNEIYLRNLAASIANDSSIKDYIFNAYSRTCEKMQQLYQQIEEQENFEPAFIEELEAAIADLVLYQILIIHKTDSFVEAFAKTPEVPDEIYAIRKKYESVFGNFETKFELLSSKLIKSLQLQDMAVSDFKFLTPQEIVGLYRDRIKPKKLIAARKKGVVINYLPTLEIITGPAAKNVIDTIRKNQERFHPLDNAKNEIKGRTVFGEGKFVGTCRVITDYEMVEDLKEGEILVTPSTMPKYNAVYRRAKAIITDEGGVLAHVSIFCREFEIIGIVGAKNATQILKDGDLVEVDANKGVVKIL